MTVMKKNKLCYTIISFEKSLFWTRKIGKIPFVNVFTEQIKIKKDYLKKISVFEII